MSSGSLLLLLGLLTLWVELTPVSSELRPEYCNLPPDRTKCIGFVTAYYYNPGRHTCLEFFYGGCDGNKNHFNTRHECDLICHEWPEDPNQYGSRVLPCPERGPPAKDHSGDPVPKPHPGLIPFSLQ